MVEVPLHSTGDASRDGRRQTMTQRGHILPVFSLFAPCNGRARFRSSGVSCDADSQRGLLQDLQSERRQHELDAELGGDVTYVENRVDLDEVERP